MAALLVGHVYSRRYLYRRLDGRGHASGRHVTATGLDDARRDSYRLGGGHGFAAPLHGRLGAIVTGRTSTAAAARTRKTTTSSRIVTAASWASVMRACVRACSHACMQRNAKLTGKQQDKRHDMTTNRLGTLFCNNLRQKALTADKSVCPMVLVWLCFALVFVSIPHGARVLGRFATRLLLL